jgi:hypothetical protein
LRDFTRVPLERFRQLHCHITGEIAVTGLLRPLQFNAQMFGLGELAGGMLEQRYQMGFGILRLEHYENLWQYTFN